MVYDEWNYRKMHQVTLASAITNYQVKYRVYYTVGIDSGNTVYLAGKCKPDFSDIRFTNLAGTVLNYWIESFVSGSYADIWVKHDSISSATGIILYYGNNSATSISNGPNTFIFFDDFTGSSIDTTKWASLGSNPVSGGICQIPFRSSSEAGYIKSVNAIYGVGYSFETRCNLPFPNTQYMWVQAGFADANQISFMIYGTKKNVRCYNGSDNLVETSQTTGAYAKKRIDAISASLVRFYENDVLLNTLTTCVPATANLPVYFGNLGVSGNIIYVDWVFVHRCLATEPTQGIWYPEESKTGAGIGIGSPMMVGA